MIKTPTTGFIPLLIAGFALVCPVDSATAQDRVSYNSQIRPVFSDKCYACHGPDEGQRQADLRLDIREDAIDYGAIDPDDWQQSLILERIVTDDPDLVMPPPSAHKDLTDEEKSLIRQWLEQGADYEPHWSFAPLSRPDLPPGDAANPIDRFIDRRLAEANLQPALRAEPHTLLRRVFLDLTGLPPDWHDVQAFAAASDRAAYEQHVDRLLQSPAYGQRMASSWLDVVRYADTVGYHGDQNQNVWAYRDWVIEALNDNKPFNEFTIEQLAGDLLPDPSTDQLVATCFNRLNMMTREGGAQPGEYLTKYTADRVRTVGMAWLGLTLGCAECHDHKFDPIATRDFYSMGAFFADIRQWGVYHDYRYTPNPDLRGFSNDHPFPPEITVESEFLRQRISTLLDEQRSLLDDLQPAGQPLTEWAKSIGEFLEQHPDGWQQPEVERLAEGISLLEDRSILVTGDVATTIELGVQGTIASMQIELLPHEQHGGSIRRGGNQRPFDLRPQVKIKRAGQVDPQDVPLHTGTGMPFSPRFSNGFQHIGILRGWRTAAHDQTHRGVWVFRHPITLQEGDTLVVDCRDNKCIGRLRISLSPLAAVRPDQPLDLDTDKLQSLIEGVANHETREQLSGNLDRATDVLPFFVRSTGQPPEIFGRLQQIDNEILQCRDGNTPVLVTRVLEEPVVARVLPRGDWQNESGEVVQPAVPQFLPGAANPDNRRLTRLDLAEWLVSDDNPLTARVVMNRLWREFFGEGLSPMTDDVGAQGQSPSHPELLDWLAVELRESGWDLKHMVRLIVTSQAYQRSSRSTGVQRQDDPENKWLARQRPRRLPAEMVRDNALAIAGLLDKTHGGPPIKPYQPARYYRHLQFPNRTYRASSARDQYRRGVYMHWQRTFLHPMLANFDAPNREDCVAMRNEANNPQQALTLLNDPAFVEMSRVMAGNLLAQHSDADGSEKLSFLFRAALARDPSDDERQSLLKLADSLTQHYNDHPEDARKLQAVGMAPTPAETIAVEQLAAWTNVCRVILNLHETITRY